MDKLKFKYILSILIDYAIYIGLIILLTNTSVFSNTLIYGLLINAMLLIFWIEELVFNGRSIGKFLMRIKIIPNGKNNKVTIRSLVVRRLLELMHVYKIIIWRLNIKINKISGTKIVNYDFNSKEIDINRNNITEESIAVTRFLRLKAFFIDLLLIIWIPVFISLTLIPTIRNQIDSWNESAIYFINGILTFLLLAYFILKDLKYKNGSFGKKTVGISIISNDSNTPSKTQLIVRNILFYGLFPIELILIMFRQKTISESVSFTHLESATKKNKII